VLIGTSSVVMDDYTMHGLNLNSQGKKRLTQLIAERVVSGHVSGVSSIPVTYSLFLPFVMQLKYNISIPVITHARASPFLA
jgi:hypothetical protein